ncbi:MAG: hypothetical protein BroJett040_15750 [Oligoflexia bacterium]|nr:MAG: hypothetical protein BroJett040_15750 [Oligoflexia bacterium]
MAKFKKGIAGIFLTEEQVVKAAHKTREMGFTKFEALSPYPIHGMEEACGIKRSWIPYVTFIAGLTGMTAGLLFTWWTSAVNWTLNIGGKPFWSLPAFIPIIFELTILFAALSSVAAMLYACGIPKVSPPIIDKDITSHKFAVFIPHDDTGYDEKKVEDLMKSLGAAEVKKAEF